MRVAFDTNILLDSILNRPERENALALMQSVAEEKMDGIISANSIMDLYYISRKTIGDRSAREAVADILSMFDIATTDGDVCTMALNVDMDDYEDAVLAVCAAREGADYIVTRDSDFIRSDGSPVKAISPEAMLDILRKK